MARALVKNASNPNPRNLLINGAMDFWQRSTSFSISSNRTYNSVDRFLVGCSGSSASTTVSRVTDVPNSQFKYSCQHVETGDAVNNALVAFQRIEAATIRPFIGRTMTLSLWVRYLTFVPPNSRVLIYTPVSGSEDSWNADPIAETNQFTGSSESFTIGAWRRISYSFTVPAAATNGLQVAWSSESYTGTPTMQHTGWMLTEGPAAPELFYRAGDSIQAELAMCQRYYEKSYEVDTAPGTATTVSQVYSIGRANSATNIDPGPYVPFKVTKRRALSDADFSFFDQTGATGWAWNNGAQVANPTGVINEGQSGFSVNYTGSTGLTTNSTYIVRGHWVVSAEL